MRRYPTFIVNGRERYTGWDREALEALLQKQKEFLSQKGVTFVERDVAQDEAALSELEQLGVMTTPVTLIDDEMVVGCRSTL